MAKGRQISSELRRKKHYPLQPEAISRTGHAQSPRCPCPYDLLPIRPRHEGPPAASRKPKREFKFLGVSTPPKPQHPHPKSVALLLLFLSRRRSPAADPPRRDTLRDQAMKLKINKACDLASISVLPPRRTRGSGGGASASASAVGGGGAAFSQGGGGGGASFSQGGGGGGAAFSQGGGGGGASFSQGIGSASLLHSQSQISQASLDENLLSLHHPSPARDQRFTLPDDSSKRMASFPANSASVVREESQLQLAKISSNCNPIHRWNSSLPDSRCQMNEDVERKFQHLASSVHKMGMVLDSVQNDVMHLNRAMKEASLDSDSIQKKFVLVENSLQQILKGQDDLKAIIEGSTKSNPDQLSILNSHTSKLDEISSTLPVLKQVQADLRQLKGDIFRILTKEMEGILRAIRSLSSRPDPLQMLADQSCTTNEKPVMNRTPAAKGSPQMNERPVADGRSQMKQTPVANGRSQMNKTPVANGRPQMRRTPVANGRLQMNHAQIAYGILKMNQAPEANGKPLMKQIPVANALPAPLVQHRKVEDLKPKLEQGKVVKVGAQNLVGSSSCRVAPKQEELAIQKVDPTKKAPWSIVIDLDDDEEVSDGSASCVILKTQTGAGTELMRREETSEEALEILRRARKRRKREQTKAIVLFGQ
uniref:Uncharacterized protein n=1 Tax=Avena sativa TaxID=4498 RepID=A0ACD5VNM3_AVESA